MRDQYAGDISDLVKFSFLRAVAGDRRLGIAWYYVPEHDGSNDGKHREYRSNPGWAALDPEVFDYLASREIRSVRDLEAAPFWDRKTSFHRVPLPSRRERDDWFAGVLESMNGVDLVFVDPDNGFSVTPSARHVSGAEIAALYRRTKAVAVIQFPPRKVHAPFLDGRHQQFADICGCKHVTTVAVTTQVRTRTGVAPRQLWFTLIGGTREMRQRTRHYADALSNIPLARGKVVEWRRTSAPLGRRTLRLEKAGRDRMLVLPEEIWKALGAAVDVQVELVPEGLTIKAAG